MRRIVHFICAALAALGALMLVAVAGLLISFTLPVEGWRTGEPPAPPLALAPGETFAAAPARVWIDTDAACGGGRRTDPDDCFAILLLAQADGVEIVGVSTVFGNATLSVTDRTTRALMAELEASGLASAPVYRGSSHPTNDGARSGASPAHEMLRAALEKGPLTIVALGPMTNLALALQGRPDLRAKVIRIVSVMGRRQGHLFHPVEGGTARSLLGHGPVFRDFNFVQDEDAATAILSMGLPLTLVPYEAARDVMIGGAVLNGMAARGGPWAWVAQRSRAWVDYWREDIGRDGFYPFDLLAAAYVVQPSLLRCADVTVAVGNDTGLLGWLGFRGLFVTLVEQPASEPIATADALY